MDHSGRPLFRKPRARCSSPSAENLSARGEEFARRIAEMTGAPVVPFFARREADHSYTLTLSPPLENFPTADAAADAVRINDLIADHVRHAPEQYFWVHKRFKARGAGYPEVY